MKYQIARSIRELGEAEWDAVAGTRLMMSHRWQRVMEASRRDYAPRYLLISDDRGPLASVIANAAVASGRGGRLGPVLQRALLVAGAPFTAADSGVAVRSGATLESALTAIERGLRELCWQTRQPVAGIGNVSDDDLPVWNRHGFLTIEQPPLNALRIAWPSYDAYLAALSGEQRRRIRRMYRRAESLDVRLEHGPITTIDPLFYPLLCELYAHHGTSAERMPFTAELFPALAREMPDEVLLFRGYVGGELAGYQLCLVNGETLWNPTAGLRYELARPSYLYFLLLDQFVRWSIERGYRDVLIGLTNNREKQEHGFQLRSRALCVRAYPGLVHGAAQIALPVARRAVAQIAASRRQQAAVGAE